MKVCIIGASGRLGQYMVEHCLERGYEVVGVCREQSVPKLEQFQGKIKIVPGHINNPDVIAKAVEDCDGVLTVLCPWGVDQYSTGTAQAVLDYAPDTARLVFSCGWHITKDGKDHYSLVFLTLLDLASRLARLLRYVDIDDQVEACNRVFRSKRLWTVVRGSDLEEGPSEGMPVWAEHVGDPLLKSNICRRTDFALFMVEALNNENLVRKAPAIVSRQCSSAIGILGPPAS